MRFDPLGAASARSDRLELPTSQHKFEGASELHDRVAHLVSHTLAPLTSYTGKKLFAYSYVKRGFEKASTTLGDLSLAEYNFGFVKLINSSVTSPADRPYMFQHLGNINEDAISYEWAGVRKWSKDICISVAEGNLSWSDQFTIDLARLKYPQDTKLTKRAADVNRSSTRSEG